MLLAIILETQAVAASEAVKTFQPQAKPEGRGYIHGMNKCKMLGPREVKISDAINDNPVEAECFCEIDQVFAKAGKFLNFRLFWKSRKIDQETGLSVVSRCL